MERFYKIDDQRCIKIYRKRHYLRLELAALQRGAGASFFPRVYDWGRDYMIREYVPGTPLNEYLRSHPFTESIARQLADMVETMRRLGFRRADTRLSHIIVDENGKLWLIDPVNTMKKSPPYPRKLLKGLERRGLAGQFLELSGKDTLKASGAGSRTLLLRPPNSQVGCVTAAYLAAAVKDGCFFVRCGCCRLNEWRWGQKTSPCNICCRIWVRRKELMYENVHTHYSSDCGLVPMARKDQDTYYQRCSGLAGVSTSTVGRVLGGYGYASPETRRRVMKAAKQLGYRPNAIARLEDQAEQDYWVFPIIHHNLFHAR